MFIAIFICRTVEASS